MRLAKVFDASDLPPGYPEPHQVKRLTYLTIFQTCRKEDIEKLQKLLMRTWDTAVEVRCWLAYNVLLCYASVDSSHDMTIFNTRNQDLGKLQGAIAEQCNLLRSVKVVVPDLEWTIANADQMAPQLDFFSI